MMETTFSNERDQYMNEIKKLNALLDEKVFIPFPPPLSYCEVWLSGLDFVISEMSLIKFFKFVNITFVREKLDHGHYYKIWVVHCQLAFQAGVTYDLNIKLSLMINFSFSLC